MNDTDTDQSMPPPPRMRIVGYADRFSVRPRESIRFMVSAETSYEASIVRLTGAPQADGPDCMEPVSWADSVQTRYPGRVQPIDSGSFGFVDAPLMQSGHDFTLQIALFATTPGMHRQFLMGQLSADGRSGAALILDESGCACLLAGDGSRDYRLVTGVPIHARSWILLTATHDAAKGLARLHQVSLQRQPEETLVAESACGFAAAPAGTPFALAATTRHDADGRTLGVEHFNGKLEAPRVLRRTVTDAEAQRFLLDPAAAASDPGLVAAWDFSIGMDSDRFTDLGPGRYHGQLVNLPTRAMTGWRWTGDTHNWTSAPEEYGAIHFHDDDLHDAGWEADFALTIPEDAASGVYAACLQAGSETESVPFFVRAAADRTGADLLLLLPTASYLAYANEHLATQVGETEALSGHVSALQKEDIHLAEHPELGLSLYDTHSDGSGVSHSSRLRPILNLRPGRKSAWIGSNPRAPWQFNADLDLVAFLEHKGIAYDIATDEDLHHEGLGLLSRYRTVMTGSHPEYHSTAMLDAIRAWLDRGGRLMYMGGNGFYWRIAFHDRIPGVIELRRAEDGIRDWVSQPGEYYHGFTGELGGLWRRIGRPPQELVGVGMATQGFDYSGYYRRAPDADNPRAAFIMAGIDDEIIGDFGHVGGGAAGLELDRADTDLGTPDHALVLASSEGHTNLTFAVPEEVDNVSDELVATRNTSLRGDIVFFETPSGGAVFSTGSIAWSGSLAHADHDNNVARMTENVLRRFLDPAPIPWPRDA